jgi:hypothetical protein
MRKAYIRYKEDIPENTNVYSLLNGLRQLGIQTVPFYGFGDIDLITDLSEDVMLVGFVGDVHQALAKMGIKKPECIDYPECLMPWMNRGVRKTTLAELFATRQRCFVKPVEEKLFTGFVWPQYTYKTAHLTDDTEVFVCDVVEFKSEYRTFILDGEILDSRRYKGDWSLVLDKDQVLEMVDAMSNWVDCPVAYCLDLGVTDTSNCCLVEVNDAYSFGSYGLPDVQLARMLVSRWEEMVVKNGKL